MPNILAGCRYRKLAETMQGKRRAYQLVSQEIIRHDAQLVRRWMVFWAMRSLQHIHALKQVDTNTCCYEHH